jgi:hypothetical protein
MKCIWKFVLDPPSLNVQVPMPLGSEIVAVREQHDLVCMWALVDPEADREIRTFAVFGTGDILPPRNLEFRGCAHLYGRKLVLHVFEVVQ